MKHPLLARITSLGIAAVAVLSLLAPLSATAADLKFEAQLLWGTNDPKSPDPRHKPISDEIGKALKESEHGEISARIPRYSCLSQHAEFVDKIVRAHKTGGQNSALAVIDGDKSNDHRTRSISHA